MLPFKLGCCPTQLWHTWLGWTCLSAYPRAAANRANLQPAHLSAPQIPSVVPWWGFLQTRSSSWVWLWRTLASTHPSGIRKQPPSDGEGWKWWSCPKCEAVGFLQRATTEQAGTGSVGKTHRTIYLWNTQHPEWGCTSAQKNSWVDMKPMEAQTGHNLLLEYPAKEQISTVILKRN